jgi:hypothetical protein
MPFQFLDHLVYSLTGIFFTGKCLIVEGFEYFFGFGRGASHPLVELFQIALRCLL